MIKTKTKAHVLIELLIFTVIIGLVSLSCNRANNIQSLGQRQNKPNIIYILADDLGYGDLGAYGQEKIETPNIDDLAENGMKFTQHYSGSPVCAPSRYMLLTGKHPGHAYIRSNEEWKERGDIWDYGKMAANPALVGQRPIPDSILTIAELLKNTGYKTGAIGKWGLGAPFTVGVPNNQGFDFFFGYNGQRMAHTYYPIYLWRNERRIALNNELIAPHNQSLAVGADPYDPESYAKFHDQPDYSAELMGEEALRFIETNKNQPFFLYYATTLPHVSLQAPQRWIDYYHEKFGDEEPYVSAVNGGGVRYVPVRYPKATYAAMISYLDEQVGTIVNKLKEQNLYRNTLIIFTSDNGPSSVGGADPVFFNSAGPFNNGKVWIKGYLHEGGIRVPMIASWPSVIKPGSQTDHISAFWDVMSTLAEVAGADLPPNRDGISFLPTLRGESDQKEHQYLYWEFPSYGGQQAVRVGKWKGIRENIFEGKTDIQLYNLEVDLQEENDISNQHPEIVTQIEQIMEEEHETPMLESMKMEQLED